MLREGIEFERKWTEDTIVMILKISKQKKTIKDLGLIYTMRHAYLFVIHEKIPRAIVKHIKRERERGREQN